MLIPRESSTLTTLDGEMKKVTYIGETVIHKFVYRLGVLCMRKSRRAINREPRMNIYLSIRGFVNGAESTRQSTWARCNELHVDVEGLHGRAQGTAQQPSASTFCGNSVYRAISAHFSKSLDKTARAPKEYSSRGGLSLFLSRSPRRKRAERPPIRLLFACNPAFRSTRNPVWLLPLQCVHLGFRTRALVCSLQERTVPLDKALGGPPAAEYLHVSAGARAESDICLFFFLPCQSAYDLAGHDLAMIFSACLSSWRSETTCAASET